MANTLLTPKIIAKEALMVLRNNAVMPNLVYRNYSDEFVGGVGDTITIRKPATFTAKDFTDAIEVQDATEQSVDVKMDKHLDVSFSVTSKELTLDISDFSEQFLVPAMRAFLDKIDSDILAEAAETTNVVEHVEGSIKPYDIIATRKALNDKAAPLTNRYFVTDTGSEADLLGNELFVSYEKTGETEGLREASLGRKFGFDIYVDQNIQPAEEDIKMFGFHRNGIALVTRPLALPRGNAESAIVNYDGFSLRVVRGYDMTKKTDIVSIDMLYGVKLLNDGLVACLKDTVHKSSDV